MSRIFPPLTGRSPAYGRPVPGLPPPPPAEGYGAPWPLAGDAMALQAPGGFDFNVQPAPTTILWVDTVNGNDGNSGIGKPAAKATLSAAMALVPADASGYQIIVADGSTLGPFEIQRSGSANTPGGLFSIVTESAGPSRAKIVGNSVAFSCVRMLHDGNPRHHIVVDGFEIDGTLAANGHCLDAEGAYGLHLRNLRCHSAPGGGVALDCVDLVTLTDCQIFDCTTTDFYSGWSVYHPMIWADASLPGYRILIARVMSWGNRYGTGTRTDNHGGQYDDSNTTQEPRAYHPGLGVSYPGRALIWRNIGANNDGAGIRAVYSARVDMLENTCWLNGRDTGRTDTWRGELAAEHCTTDIKIRRNALVCDSSYEADAEAIHVASATGTYGAMSNIVVEENMLWDLGGTNYAYTDGTGAPTISFPTNIAQNPNFTDPQAIAESGDWSRSGIDPDADIIALLDAECVEYWLFNEANGSTILGRKGVADATIESGTALRSQPSLFTGNPAQCTATNGANALRAVVAAGDVPAHQGVLVVYAQRPQASRTWQTFANRDDGFAIVGGWGLAVTAAGEPRAYLRTAGGSQVLLGSAAATFGNVEAIGMSCGAAGQKLWWGNAVVASAAGITDAIGGTSAISLFQGQAGATQMNGAIQLVALFATQAGADTNIPLIVAELKAALLHANADEAGEIAAGGQATVPVLANDFYSGAPTVAIDRQPSLGSAEVVSGDIRITAGSTAGADSLDYTVNASPIARVNFSVSSLPPPGNGEDPAAAFLADPFYNPFNPSCEAHKPIGTGVQHDGDAAASTQSLALLNGITINVATGPFGLWCGAADSSGPVVQVTNRTGAPGANFGDPVNVRFPAGTAHHFDYPADRDGNIAIYDRVAGKWQHIRGYAWNNGSPQGKQYREYGPYDLGHPGAGLSAPQAVGTSASGVAAPFGILRSWEFNNPDIEIEHMLQIVLPRLDGTQILGKSGYFFAGRADGSAYLAGNNGGNIPYGGRLILPASVNIDALGLSAIGQKMARNARRYGWGVVDGGGGAIRADQGIDTALRSQFITYDCPIIWARLRLVTGYVTGGWTITGSNTYTGTTGTVSGSIVGGGAALDNARNTGLTAP